MAKTLWQEEGDDQPACHGTPSGDGSTHREGLSSWQKRKTAREIGLSLGVDLAKQISWRLRQHERAEDEER